ncbi:unnamed protein product [Symbiodinium sp. CCMP2592]|nr:unnamed protein product [Symbiodinium sp. CCMP2592]
MVLTGVVKGYDTAKGFGFIVPTGSRTDLFVLWRDVIGGTLQAGDKVTFDEGLNERTGRPKAFRVAGGSGPAPGGKGEKGKRGAKQFPGAVNGGLVAGPHPGGSSCGPCGCPAPCGLMLGGGCGLGAGGCAGLPDGIKSGVVKIETAAPHAEGHLAEVYVATVVGEGRDDHVVRHIRGTYIRNDGVWINERGATMYRDESGWWIGPKGYTTDVWAWGAHTRPDVPQLWHIPVAAKKVRSCFRMTPKVLQLSDYLSSGSSASGDSPPPPAPLVAGECRREC